jgi:hypothetical protein
MGKNQDPDPGRIKDLKFFDAVAHPDPGSKNLFDPGSGMKKFGSGNRDKHPGSATLCIVISLSATCPTFNLRIYKNKGIKNEATLLAYF